MRTVAFPVPTIDLTDGTSWNSFLHRRNHRDFVSLFDSLKFSCSINRNRVPNSVCCLVFRIRKNHHFLRFTNLSFLDEKKSVHSAKSSLDGRTSLRRLVESDFLRALILWVFGLNGDSIDPSAVVGEIFVSRGHFVVRMNGRPRIDVWRNDSVFESRCLYIYSVESQSERKFLLGRPNFVASTNRSNQLDEFSCFPVSDERFVWTIAWAVCRVKSFSFVESPFEIFSWFCSWQIKERTRFVYSRSAAEKKQTLIVRRRVRNQLETVSSGTRLKHHFSLFSRIDSLNEWNFGAFSTIECCTTSEKLNREKRKQKRSTLIYLFTEKRKIRVKLVESGRKSVVWRRRNFAQPCWLNWTNLVDNVRIKIVWLRSPPSKHARRSISVDRVGCNYDSTDDEDIHRMEDRKSKSDRRFAPNASIDNQRCKWGNLQREADRSLIDNSRSRVRIVRCSARLTSPNRDGRIRRDECASDRRQNENNRRDESNELEFRYRPTWKHSLTNDRSNFCLRWSHRRDQQRDTNFSSIETSENWIRLNSAVKIGERKLRFVIRWNICAFFSSLRSSEGHASSVRMTTDRSEQKEKRKENALLFYLVWFGQTDERQVVELLFVWHFDREENGRKRAGRRDFIFENDFDGSSQITDRFPSSPWVVLGVARVVVNSTDLERSSDCIWFHFVQVERWIQGDLFAQGVVDNGVHLKTKRVYLNLCSQLIYLWQLPGSQRVPDMRDFCLSSFSLWPVSLVLQFHQTPHFAHWITLHKPFSFMVKCRQVGHSLSSPLIIISLKAKVDKNVWAPSTRCFVSTNLSRVVRSILSQSLAEFYKSDRKQFPFWLPRFEESRTENNEHKRWSFRFERAFSTWTWWWKTKFPLDWEIRPRRYCQRDTAPNKSQLDTESTGTNRRCWFDTTNTDGNRLDRSSDDHSSETFNRVAETKPANLHLVQTFMVTKSSVWS